MKVLPIAAAVLALAAPAAAQPLPARYEFQVNTFTTYAQGDPAVGKDAAGGFVVVWESVAQDGASLGVFGRRFDSLGEPLGGEFQVNSHTASIQANPAVAVAPSGRFVVVWESYGQDGDDSGVFGQRFDSAGATSGPEFRVNSTTIGYQYDPSVTMDPSGDFVVVWESYPQDGSGYGVVGRRFDSAGATPGPEFLVNSYTTSHQLAASVAALDGGGFVVAWESAGQDGSSTGVFARLFDGAGAPLGQDLQVNTYTTGAQDGPSVAAGAAGGFVVVWESDGQDGDAQGIFARRYDGAGSPLGGEFQVNEQTLGAQSDPRVAADGRGGFAVAWESLGQDGDYLAVVARHFDSSGGATGPEFQVNSYTTGDQRDASVAMDDAGDFVVAWEGYYEDGSGLGVFAQRLTSPSRIGIVEPPHLGSVDCGDPRFVRPTMRWEPGDYDRFRVFLAPDPAFAKGKRVTSGDTLLRTSSWTPSPKKWRLACARALQADPNTPTLHLRVFGVDRDAPRDDPARKMFSEPVQVSIQP